MSSPNVTNDFAADLAAITSNSIMFTRYWCFTMFIVGLIGHSLNIYVFTRPTLQSNPCARYFMVSAVAGHGVIFVILPVRLLQFGYGLSLFLPLVSMCKFLTFLFSWIRILPCWFIALASVDRFMCSSLSATYRGWSSIRVSNRLILLTVILIGFTQVPILIFYTISTQPTVCLGQPNLFQKLNGVIILIIWSIIPFLVMLVFGFLIIRHVQQSTRAVANQNIGNHRQKRTKFIDRQLIQITLIQSILFMLTSAAGAVGGMYNVLDDNSRKNPLELAKQNFLGNILSFVALLGPCISFYLCTLSSQLFRRELLDLFHLRRQNPIHPIVNIVPIRLRTN